MYSLSEIPMRSGMRSESPVLLSVVIAAALISGCQGSANSSATPRASSEESLRNTRASASEELRPLIEQFVDARMGENDRRELRDVSAESFLGEIASDRQLLSQLHDIAPDGLSPPERIDRKLMIGLLESDVYSAEKRRMWEIDASLYVPARQIGALLEPQAAKPPGQRADDLRKLLVRIPEHVAEGKRNLRHPPRRFTEAAIFKTEATIKSLKEDTPSLVPPAAGSGGDLKQAVEAALQALDEYNRFLRDELLPRSTGNWAIGREHYDYILQHRWHLDADADDILARGLKAFEDTEALAQEVSARLEPGKHWSEVYEKLTREHPAADQIKDAYQKEIDAAREFVLKNQVVTLPAGERVITVDTPPAMRRSSPFGTFQSVDQFDVGMEGRLVLTPIEDWMSPEQRAQRLRSHHYAWIPIIAVHEAYPGHHVDALKTRENPRILRKVVREPIFSEGWGLFTEELMFELGFLEGDAVRLTQLRNRLWRAARVIMDVSLHTGRMSFEEALDFLTERVRFERYAAELEVGMYTERPTYVLGYLIGMQEIMSIRDEYVARFGQPSPPSEFYDKLLRVGSIPPVLVREALFDEVSTESSSSAGDD